MLYLVASLVPVANEQGEIPVGLRIRHRDLRPLVDIQSAEATGGPLHPGGEKVSVTSNLVLSLKLICIVRARRNGAVGPQDSILPRVLPLLDPIPGYEYRFVNVVDDADDDVVVGDTVEARPRELCIDENPLLLDAERGDGSIGHCPGEVPVRVIGCRDKGQGQQRQGSKD